MALKGTLKDFGIADILQLIGQQQKTGTLHLRSKQQEVNVGFKEGSIVKAETTTRRKKELIGNMLVRAQLITEKQLQDSLETQKRTLKRLGDVLVSSHYITEKKFRQMCQLQATETLYALFQWKSGTYEFMQEEVEHDPEALSPLRAESVLMEGFRMVDEWPLIRRRITSYDMTFEKLKPLPIPPPTGDGAPLDGDDFDDDLKGFGEAEPEEKKGDFKSLGEAERRVYGVVGPMRTVRELIDYSCLGEFETCKALTNLCNLEYLKPVQTSRSSGMGQSPESRERILKAGGLALGVLVLLVGLGVGIRHVRWGDLSIQSGAGITLTHRELQRFVAQAQLTRLRDAVDVYRTEQGELPDDLKSLVQAGLLLPDDLRYPWQETYYYRRVDAQHFVLLPPLR